MEDKLYDFIESLLYNEIQPYMRDAYCGGTEAYLYWDEQDIRNKIREFLKDE